MSIMFLVTLILLMAIEGMETAVPVEVAAEAVEVAAEAVEVAVEAVEVAAEAVEVAVVITRELKSKIQATVVLVRNIEFDLHSSKVKRCWQQRMVFTG